MTVPSAIAHGVQRVQRRLKEPRANAGRAAHTFEACT